MATEFIDICDKQGFQVNICEPEEDSEVFRLEGETVIVKVFREFLEPNPGIGAKYLYEIYCQNPEDGDTLDDLLGPTFEMFASNDATFLADDLNLEVQRLPTKQ